MEVKKSVLDQKMAMNPDILARQAAIAEANIAYHKNYLKRHYAKLHHLCQEAQIDLMKVIVPLDEEELQRTTDAEFMESEKIVLQKALEGSAEDIDIKTLLQHYAQELQELQTNLIEQYATRLKSRDAIFKEHKLVKLNNILRQSLVVDFEHSLTHLVENHQARFKAQSEKFTDRKDIMRRLDDLENAFTALQEETNKIIDEKTLHVENYNEVERHFKGKRAVLDQKTHQWNDALDHSYPARCARGELEAVRQLTRAHSGLIHQSNTCGELPLHRACEAGQIEVVQYLLEKGAKPTALDDAKGLSAFHYACKSPELLILKLLCSSSELNFFSKPKYKALRIVDNQKRTLLHSAVFFNNVLAVKWLINKNMIDLNAQDDLMRATALHLAAVGGYADIAEYLIFLGANIHLKNKSDERPIFTAALYGHSAVLKVFLNQGYCLTPQEIQTLYATDKFTPVTQFSEMRYRYACNIELAYEPYIKEYQTPLRLKKEQENLESVQKERNNEETETSRLAIPVHQEILHSQNLENNTGKHLTTFFVDPKKTNEPIDTIHQKEVKLSKINTAQENENLLSLSNEKSSSQERLKEITFT